MKSFTDSRERLSRADAHRNGLADAWNRFLEDAPYRVAIHVDANGAGRIWIVPTYKSFPPFFSLQLGEMLYQLRACLDSCVYQAAVYETGQDPPPKEQNLEFPVADDATTFEGKTWKIEPLSEKCRAIIRNVQPYNADNVPEDERFMNEMLPILNHWARIDRHRRLHVVGAWAGEPDPKFRLPPGVRLKSLEFTRGHFLKYQHHQIVHFTLEGWRDGMPLEANPDLTLDIAINEHPPPRSDSDTLSERCTLMCRAVDIIIRRFEESF